MGGLRATQRSVDTRWWLFEDKSQGSAAYTLHGGLFTLVRRLRNKQRPRRDMYLFWSQLFGVNEIAGIGLTNYDSANAGFVPATMPFNIVRNGVKTVTAKIAKNRPLPMAVTSRGSYKQTKRARGLTRYMEGEFERLKLFALTPSIARDAMVYGTGIVHVYRRKGADRPQVDRIFPWEVLVDLADGRYGKPKNFYLVRWVDRAALQGEFPDSAEAIETGSASAGAIDDVLDYDDDSDVVLVVEAWHLPPPPLAGEAQGERSVDSDDPERGAPAKDPNEDNDRQVSIQYLSAGGTTHGVDRGRHIIAIDGHTLLDEKWTRNYFPFLFLRYDEPLIGFWGDSLAGEMSGFQYEINYVSETLHLAHRLVGTGIWMVPDGADIPDAHFQDDVGFVLKYKMGFKPDYVNPEPAHEQTYTYLESLSKWALNFSGISQQAAQSQKPAGITAAKALQVIDEVEADRFALFERAWENFHVDIAERLIDIMKEIAEEGHKNLTVKVKQRKHYLAVDWADVDMDRDIFSLDVFPTSLLARTPAARLQQVQDLFQAGLIDRSLFLKLLDAPDIDAETDLDAAGRTIVDEQIELMLDCEDTNDPEAQQQPDSCMDLIYAMYRAQQTVNLGRLQNVPDENLQLLRDYIALVRAELVKRVAAQAPAPANANGAPAQPGAPGQPPAPQQAAPAPMQGTLQGQSAA